MIAEHRPRTPGMLTDDDLRVLSRQDAIDDVINFTVCGRGLSDYAQDGIRQAMRAGIDPLLRLADEATVACLEAEAVQRRIAAHQATHDECGPCDTLRLLLIRFRRFDDRAVKAYAALAKGGRR